MCPPSVHLPPGSDNQFLAAKEVARLIDIDLNPLPGCQSEHLWQAGMLHKSVVGCDLFEPGTEVFDPELILVGYSGNLGE